MFNRKILQIALTALVAGCAFSPAVFAQGTTTLRDPLIPGALDTPPGTCPDMLYPPKPPAPGDGPTPQPVTPGIGTPNYEPWVPAIPADTIGVTNSGISLPVSPPITMPPGILGPALTPVIPTEPSTPGAAPPWTYGYNGALDPVEQTAVQPQGGLPGTGGYNTTIPKHVRGEDGRQDTFQGQQRRASILGGGGYTQDEVTETGPLAGYGVPFGVPTGNGYNNGPPGTGSDLRFSSIDLGGGMTMRVGGECKISTGSTLQDYGSSATRNNGVLGLTAHQSTEFGQGFHRMPIMSNKTTDFGFPLKQWIQPNTNPQAQPASYTAPPNAIETNY